MSSTDQNDTASENELANRIALALAVAGPAGWQRIDAAFLSASADAGRVVAFDAKGRAMSVEPSETMQRLVRRAFAQLSEQDVALWWRLKVGLTEIGEAEVGYSFGRELVPESAHSEPKPYLASLMSRLPDEPKLLRPDGAD
ncbi:hypothetical protein ACIBG0_41320 [Nocardia sp. NPDC050630]|uniref:hypothetical protein n=1 Tax=Nocardia sp. NPDC050630 TaxID=3364321 RepID=UPI0037B27058